MTATMLDVSPDHYIGGRRVASEARFETRNPYTGEVLAEVSRADAATVDLAVRAAHDAFPAWAALGPAGRAEHPALQARVFLLTGGEVLLLPSQGFGLVGNCSAFDHAAPGRDRS